MKIRYLILYLLSAILCVTGILLRSRLNVLDVVFAVIGIALFLVTFARHSISLAPRCPNCGTILYRGHIRTMRRQENGIVTCEACGSLVDLNLPRKKS